jgi:(2Fe-2S) ferredoxin
MASGRRVHVFVCVNERSENSPLPCCAARGGRELFDAFQAELAARGFPRGVKVSSSSCLTTCQCGPTVAVYPEGVWYGDVSTRDVSDLLDAHISGDGPFERRLLPTDIKVW